MAYMICKHPAVRMDLMVREECWAKVVSIAQRTGVTYEKEEHVDLEGGEKKYILIRDLKGHAPIGGNNLGEFIGLLYGLEWDDVIAQIPEQKKFYILMTPRKRGKGNDRKDRKEADPGRES